MSCVLLLAALRCVANFARSCLPILPSPSHLLGFSCQGFPWSDHPLHWGLRPPSFIRGLLPPWICHVRKTNHGGGQGLRRGSPVWIHVAWAHSRFLEVPHFSSRTRRLHEVSVLGCRPCHNGCGSADFHVLSPSWNRCNGVGRAIPDGHVHSDNIVDGLSGLLHRIAKKASHALLRLFPPSVFLILPTGDG